MSLESNLKLWIFHFTSGGLQEDKEVKEFGTRPAQFPYLLQTSLEVVGLHLWSRDTQLFHHLNVMFLPDSLLKGGWREVDVPAKTQTFQHPELIQFGQVLPVPAHLWMPNKLRTLVSQASKMAARDFCAVIPLCP